MSKTSDLAANAREIDLKAVGKSIAAKLAVTTVVIVVTTVVVTKLMEKKNESTTEN